MSGETIKLFGVLIDYICISKIQSLLYFCYNNFTPLSKTNIPSQKNLIRTDFSSLGLILSLVSFGHGIRGEMDPFWFIISISSKWPSQVIHKELSNTETLTLSVCENSVLLITSVKIKTSRFIWVCLIGQR